MAKGDQGHSCQCEGKCGKNPDLERLRAFAGPYAYQVSRAMVSLAEAVELALNSHDAAVIEEMRTVAIEVFDQADEALREASSTLQ